MYVENYSVEGFYVEVNLLKSKWLFCCSNSPIRCKVDFNLEHSNRSLLLYSSDYKTFIIIEDFNVEANGWKKPKYGVLSGPYFSLLGLNTFSAQVRKNTDQKKLRIWKFFTQWGNYSAISLISNTYDLKSHIQDPTYYKNSNKPSSIDFILANKRWSFQHSCVIETGLILARWQSLLLWKNSLRNFNRD